MRLLSLASILLFLTLYKLSAQNIFYYYQGEKIFLKERNDKLLVKRSKDANKIKLLDLIQADSFVEIVSKRKTPETITSFIILETKDKKNFPISTIDKYQKIPDINSALPMLQYEDGKLQGLTDEFIVKLKVGITFEQLQKLVKEKHCSIIKENEFVKNQFLISVSKTSNLNSLQLANFFYETGLFEFSEPNFFHENINDSNDPLFGNQWALKNNGQNGGTVSADIKIEQAWTISEGRPEVHIAVIDDGVDLTHPDLLPNLLPGFDATGNGTAGGPLAGEFHGTVCAGIIAAVKDNGIGVSGVAPKCKIIPVHINFTAQEVADGIEWAWNPLFGNADILSNSWHLNSPSNVVTNAINNATTQGRTGLGCVVLFASGNIHPIHHPSNNINYPAYLPNVIAVGASSINDNKAHYSCYGGDLDVVAPGGDQNIYSTDIIGSNGYSTSDYVSNFQGTSAACPYAAGVVALILSVNRCLTQTQVKNILELSCEKKGGYCYYPGHPNGLWSTEMGYGRINAYNAVQHAFGLQTNLSINTSGYISAISNNLTWTLSPVPCSQFAAGNYIVKRYEVKSSTYYGTIQSPILIGNANGFSAASPTNGGSYYMDIVNLTPTSVTVRTWVYKVVSTITGQQLSWIPTDPSNVRFNYTILSSLSTDLYFQNQIATGTQTHNAANKIEAGKNVTNAVPVGNYVVQSGANVTFHAGNKIVLSEGFIAKTGTNFHASVKPFFTCSQYPMGAVNHPFENKNFLSVFPDFKSKENKMQLYEYACGINVGNGFNK